MKINLTIVKGRKLFYLILQKTENFKNRTNFDVRMLDYDISRAARLFLKKNPGNFNFNLG